ncbi:helicase-associated domain-containing protein [Microlunatus ginsengisoli]|uniref:helicase-associated domain-containing protein n=1 Tax=Microlunatus ginsengisoli TaxID=363863 RepID=UPI0031CED3A7
MATARRAETRWTGRLGLIAVSPRTLTEYLRALDRERLARVLELRPDLCFPRPGDLVELATRATTSTSVGRALESLNAYQRVVTEAIAALPTPTSVADVGALLGGAPTEVADAVAALRERALLWGPDDSLNLVRAVREAFEPYPGGLAPPSFRALTDGQIADRIAACDDSVRPVLDRLAWSPTGAVRNATRQVQPEHARSPIEQLLAQGLIRPLDADTVILPREVALYVRGGRFSPDPVPASAPAVSGTDRTASLVDRAAAGAAFALLHDLELTVHALEKAPHRLLRAGGLGTRDIAALGRALDSTAAHAGFVLECASAAGLVAPGSNLCLLPTAAFDRWLTHDAAVRWRIVADAWMRVDRLPSRASEPGAHVLGPEADARGAADVRADVLRIAATAGTARVLDLEQLTSSLAWHRPRVIRGHGPEAATLVDWVWREATWLGVVSLGCLSSFGPALLDPAAPEVTTPLPPELADLFPAPVEQIIIQTDLTAVAPGPLPHRISRDLRLLADQESRGGAGVFRFSPASLRRGFDTGWSAAEIHAWLEQHSQTGVPQPLRYLVDDVARQFGSIRLGGAASYLRSDDPAQTAALLAHPEAAYLGLREIAPGVLVSNADTYEVVSVLRAAGLNPAVEDETGRTLSAPPQLRAPAPLVEQRPRPPRPGEVADALVRRSPDGGGPARTGPSTDRIVADLRRALDVQASVDLTYTDADGFPTRIEFTPVSVQDGVVSGVGTRNRKVLGFPLGRIVRVDAPDPDGPDGLDHVSHPAGAG